MKILYFHQHFSTPQGATGTRSYEMARRLIVHGHKVTMVCGSGFMAKTGLMGASRNGIRRGVVDGIDVIEISLTYSNYDSLPKRAMVFLRYALKSVGIAWKENYDLMFATSTPLTAGIPGILMRLLKPGKRFVFEVRDLWPELPKAMGVVTNPAVLLGMGILEQLSYLTMHAGVGLSPGIRKGMLKGAGSGKKVAMIPNGCDLEMFCPAKEGSDNNPTQFPDIPATGLRCIFTGAHGIANGLDAVLDAARILKEKSRGDIHLIFIGDGKIKPHLIQRATNETLNNCKFLDPIPKTRLADLLQQVDVGMMILDNVPAFYYGTSPNKFFDYISSGLPVLNNYPGWLAGLISEHECGIAIPPEDPVAFADALIQLADNPDMRKNMSINGRKLAETQFPRDMLADKLVSFLETIGEKEIQNTSLNYDEIGIAQ